MIRIIRAAAYPFVLQMIGDFHLFGVQPIPPNNRSILLFYDAGSHIKGILFVNHLEFGDGRIQLEESQNMKSGRIDLKVPGYIFVEKRGARVLPGVPSAFGRLAASRGASPCPCLPDQNGICRSFTSSGPFSWTPRSLWWSTDRNTCLRRRGHRRRPCRSRSHCDIRPVYRRR